MDDMDAFERQVAGEVLRGAAPPRPVDVAAIFTAITATGSPKWWSRSTFSAARFVVAGVLVALFGGVLLAGLSTHTGEEGAPPAAATATGDATATVQTRVRSDLLPGVALRVEEVEPSVYRVLNDGVRDFVAPGEPWGVQTWIGADGSVWREQDGGILEIGRERVWQFPDHLTSAEGDYAVSEDGTIWLGFYDLWSFEGKTWRRDPSFGRDHRQIRALELGPDGDLWAAWSPERLYGPKSRRIRVSRRTDDGWVDLPAAGGFESSATRTNLEPFFAIDADGEPWISGIGRRDGSGQDGSTQLVHGLLHFDGSAWELVDPAESGPYDVYSSLVASGADGTLWATFRQADDANGFVARRVGGAWTVYSSADGVPEGMSRREQATFEGGIRAASDGSVWMTAASGLEGPSDGVARFDGVSWQRYLSGQLAWDLDVAPNGTAWVNVGDSTYVITPEAVAE
jgi:hypothetical protein